MNLVFVDIYVIYYRIIYYRISSLLKNLLKRNIGTKRERVALLNGTYDKVNPVVSIEQIINARKAVNEVYMDEKIEKYILDIVFATRYPEKYNLEKLKPLISFGSSPRGSISLGKAAKCYAFIKRRGYVIPEDIRAIAIDVLKHRIGITYEAEAEDITSVDIINAIINEIQVP